MQRETWLAPGCKMLGAADSESQRYVCFNDYCVLKRPSGCRHRPVACHQRMALIRLPSLATRHGCTSRFALHTVAVCTRPWPSRPTLTHLQPRKEISAQPAAACAAAMQALTASERQAGCPWRGASRLRRPHPLASFASARRPPLAVGALEALWADSAQAHATDYGFVLFPRGARCFEAETLTGTRRVPVKMISPAQNRTLGACKRPVLAKHSRLSICSHWCRGSSSGRRSPVQATARCTLHRCTVHSQSDQARPASRRTSRRPSRLRRGALHVPATRRSKALAPNKVQKVQCSASHDKHTISTRP